MSEVPLRNRAGAVVAVAIVDEEDLERVDASGPWHLSKGYVQHTQNVGGHTVAVQLHRYILGLGPDDPMVDHVDRDPLNCRRSNLRLATAVQNAQNRSSRGHADNTSGYRGVTWVKSRGRWQAQCQVNKKHHHLGYFSSAEEANAVVVAFRSTHAPYSAEVLEDVS